MSNGLENVILDMMDTTQEPEDYKGEDGLLYCGKCHTPKEAYLQKERIFLGVTVTRLNVTVVGRSVKSGKKRNWRKNTVTRLTV